MIKDSVTIMRGCFGGCTFCSITAHQGRIIQSRSQESVLGEIARDGRRPAISRARSATSAGRPPTCTRCGARGPRSRRSAAASRACIPTICKLLGTDHGPLIELMRKARADAGDQEGAGRQRHPHGPGPPLAAVHPRTCAAPRRRAPEGRPRAHRPRGAGPDAQAVQRRLRGVRRRVPARSRRRRARSSTSCRTSSPATRAATWTR